MAPSPTGPDAGIDSDPERTDRDRVDGGTLIAVDHDTTYSYQRPVLMAQHEAFVQPLDDPWQQLESFTLEIEPAPQHRSEGRDSHGNARCFFTIASSHSRLKVRARSRVRVRSRDAVIARAQRGLGCAQAAAALRYAAGARFEPAVEFCFASPFVPLYQPLFGALHDYGAAVLEPGVAVGEAATRLMHRIHADFSYRSRSTTVDTPLADVLATRCGVCQDFAHLMIGVLRAHGLAARYVSGYLLTSSGDGSAAPAADADADADVGLIGSDASHAWVAVWCPRADGEGDWLELDPTNDLLPSTTHVRLARGRDFGDVSPLRGIIRGGREHSLQVGVRTSRLDPR